MEYVTWNNYNLDSIRKAELRKSTLESKGYTLIHEAVNCLTYKLETKEKRKAVHADLIQKVRQWK